MIPGPGELAIIFAVALVVFGPKKLPELGKAIGQGLGNFKKSLKDAQEEVKASINVVEQENASETDNSEKSKTEGKA